ncbi:MAG: carbamoyltransferase HypF [Candidatus Hydrogenedentes bacterium]|nr:carbamoyltransferase HypF [Candidatus Hydrogenedentota bacterium]
MSKPVVRIEARIYGAVQGVGFRPFVYRTAMALGLSGSVRNTTEGVLLIAEGPREQLEALLLRLEREKPPLSLIERIDAHWGRSDRLSGFRIEHSTAAGASAAHILPDVATCADCLREIRDPDDRRYRYPFTNCTHCGPRFTIIHRLPYDRPNTSMHGFTMCAECRTEYEDPADRRFHAQPTACPACGPHLELWDARGAALEMRDAALRRGAAALLEGQVVAVKGLGGFHLMADAHSGTAVARLRLHKHREEKPFALMYPGLDMVRRDCVVPALEAQLLESPEAPIVLLHRRDGDALAPNIAPGAPRYGVMLPCTPLHHLLLGEVGGPVVATSGNLSEEPICIDEREAVERLRGIADLYLVHNRPIVRHVDDSIVQVVLGREMVLRRARGYAPLPIRVTPDGPPLLAAGGHLKNTVAVAKDGNVFLSQHIGDLETPKAFDAFLEAARSLETLYEVRPVHAACDLHPDYLSAKHARSLGLPVTETQHHYAHVVACMAEHGLDGTVLGVSWDGTGYGPDGVVWGGEFLRATRCEFERVAHLRPFRLPGGDRAVKEPRRSALGMLYGLYGGATAEQADLAPLRAFQGSELRPLLRMLATGAHAPLTTSAGRLFDAAAALLGLRQYSAYEGQAAMMLEYAARRCEDESPRYAFALHTDAQPQVLDWAPVARAAVGDVRAGIAVERIALGFHAALADAILTVAQACGLADIVLTGGCFQNVLLTELTAPRLRKHGFRVFLHHRVPPNDGGIALGQAAHALGRLRNAKGHGDVPGDTR